MQNEYTLGLLEKNKHAKRLIRRLHALLREKNETISQLKEEIAMRDAMIAALGQKKPSRSISGVISKVFPGNKGE